MIGAGTESIVTAILSSEPRIAEQISREEVSARVETLVAALTSESLQKRVED